MRGSGISPPLSCQHWQNAPHGSGGLLLAKREEAAETGKLASDQGACATLEARHASCLLRRFRQRDLLQRKEPRARIAISDAGVFLAVVALPALDLAGDGGEIPCGAVLCRERSARLFAHLLAGNEFVHGEHFLSTSRYESPSLADREPLQHLPDSSQYPATRAGRSAHADRFANHRRTKFAAKTPLSRQTSLTVFLFYDILFPLYRRQGIEGYLS